MVLASVFLVSVGYALKGNARLDRLDLFTFGVGVLLLGLALAVVVMVLPGPLYGKPEDPALAQMCPQCGLQMVFVDYQSDAREYRCTEHGRYLMDSEGLCPWPEPPAKKPWFVRKTSN
jgi:hypothetical protein